nr:FHA domain-containing protein [Williamsia sterculiae]
MDGVEQQVPPAGPITVGRTPENSVTVVHPLVSRRHLVIEWRHDTWIVVDTDSTNGFFLDGSRHHSVPITGRCRLRLGDPTTGPVVDLQPVGGVRRPVDHVVPAAPHLQALPGDPSAPIPVVGVATIGRTPDNDVVVGDVLASRTHARVQVCPTGLVIEDLGSVNGTFVDGTRVERHLLRDGAVVTIGNSDFVVTGHALRPGPPPATTADGSPPRGLQVSGIGVTVDNRPLVQDVGFDAAVGTLTAIIGPSGAGKSTVSRVVAGLVAPTVGTVHFEGRGVHADYQALRTRIGMVPQDDVLHRQLTLVQGLRYAAELRLPPDMTAADRERVVAGVLAELQLTEHAHTRVDRLSGGQRKRASVATELLTGPSLLILDEPTSGLDPALDRQVMTMLRRLADAGRVVLVVTHSVSHLSMCDQVVLLAAGGRTAFCGPPRTVGVAMGTDDWAEIFAYVTARPDDAHLRHRNRLRPPPAPPPESPDGPPTPTPQTGVLRQASTVARRQLRLVLADRGYLIFLTALPVVLGALSLVIPGHAGFTVNGADSAGESVQVLVVLVVGAAFMGTALTVRDLVGERPMFERERAVGLRVGSYLLAKAVVYGVVAGVQVGVMVVIAYLGRGIPGPGVLLPGPVELFVDIGLLACVGVAVGLAISAVARSAEQTMPPLVLVVMVQLVFCAGLFPIAGRPGLEQVSWLFPTRWGYASAAATVDLRRLSPLSPPTAHEALWDHRVATVLVAWLVLAIMGSALLGFTWGRLCRTR